MFFPSKQKSTPSDVPKADGVELNVRLSGPTLIKIFSIVGAISFGAGVLVDNQGFSSTINDVPVGKAVAESCPSSSVKNATLGVTDPS